MAGQQKGKRHNYRRGNPQRRVLAEQIVKGKSVAEAGRIAGYSCPQAASNALRSMREEIAKALERNDWGPEKFVTKHLIPMLTAKKVLYAQNGGIFTDKRVVRDNATRLAAGDQYLKILGAYAPLSVEHSGVVVHELTEREKQEAVECVARILEYEERERKLLKE